MSNKSPSLTELRAMADAIAKQLNAYQGSQTDRQREQRARRLAKTCQEGAEMNLLAEERMFRQWNRLGVDGDGDESHTDVFLAYCQGYEAVSDALRAAFNSMFPRRA